VIALSWSRLSTYQQCPKQFYLKFISKSFKEEEKGIHLVKGEQLHKQMEEYILAKNGQGVMPLGFSPEVKQSLPYVDKLYNIYDSVHAEAQVACDVNWKPTEWFGADTAWRAIWDATGLRINTCFIGDWKSGKVYPMNRTVNPDGSRSFGQLHLSSVIALQRWDALPEVISAYVYLEHKVVQTVKVTREPTEAVDANREPIPHLTEVRLYFERWFERVQMEKAWEPTPNDNCKWCQATRAQCKFSRKL
jgi:hypothetical protein